MALTQAQIDQYRRQGYVVISGIFSPSDAEHMADHFMTLRAQGPRPGDFGGVSSDDANQKYPRFINMHTWDTKTDSLAKHPTLIDISRTLLDDTPCLQQTMLYFKPPGAMGQGLHQDEQYITKDPIVGVWVALDECSKENGQMQIVPESHKRGLVEVEPADLSQSFTPGQTKLAPDAQIIGIDMQPGDVLFFHGLTIHGSYPNTTTDRFRRTFIIHYYAQNATIFEPGEGMNMRDLDAKPPDAPPASAEN